MAPYWKTVSLHAMTPRQWEDLCDSCAKCCLVKLVDEDAEDEPGEGRTGEDPTEYTNVACRLLDLQTCRCGSYADRLRLVPGCVRLTPETLPRVAGWLPKTCAYRLVWEGRDLPWWHPLVSGEQASVHRSGASLLGDMVSENEVPEEDLEHYILSRTRIDLCP